MKAKDNTINAVCAILSIAIFAVDTAIPLGFAGGALYVLVILLSNSLAGNKIQFFWALIASLLTVAGLFLSPSGASSLLAISNRLLSLFLIWATAILGWKLKSSIMERDRALTDLTTVRSFLPICAWCKNVRDDQGYWDRIEDFFTAQSGQEFTHCMCPECEKKVFADLEERNRSGMQSTIHDLYQETI